MHIRGIFSYMQEVKETFLGLRRFLNKQLRCVLARLDGCRYFLLGIELIFELRGSVT